MRHSLCVLQVQILGARYLYYQETRSASSWFLIFETSIFSALTNFLHTRLHFAFSFLDRMRNINFRRLGLLNLKNSDHVQLLRGGLLREQHTVLVVLLSTHVAEIVHIVFVFSNHQTKCGEGWFLVSHTLHYHPTTSTVVVPGLPLCSASSIDSSPTANGYAIKMP